MLDVVSIGSSSFVEGSLLVSPSIISAVLKALRAKCWAYPGSMSKTAHRGDKSVLLLNGAESHDWRVVLLSFPGAVVIEKAVEIVIEAINGELIKNKSMKEINEIPIVPSDVLSNVPDLLNHCEKFPSKIYFLKGVLSTSPLCRIKEVSKYIQYWNDIREQAKKDNKFTFCELFAGIGGFRLGIEELGGCCIMASEIDYHASKCYEDNFKERPLSDISQIGTNDIGSFDLLVGGFPCQSYCRLNVDPKGLASNNGQLIHHIFRLLKMRQPKAFLLENVPNLRSVNEGKDFELILEGLRFCGYNVEVKFIDARAYGVVQKRIRLYFVGIRNDIYDEKIGMLWPQVPDPPELSETGVVSDKRYRLETILEEVGPEDMKRYQLSEKKWDLIKETTPKKADHDIILDRRLARPEGFARTLVSTYRSGLKLYSEFVPLSTDLKIPPRLYTPRECCRLMGFPESFKIYSDEIHFYNQIGNAVVPVVINEIVKHAILPWISDKSN